MFETLIKDSRRPQHSCICLQIHPSTDGAAAGTEGWQAMLDRCAKGAHDASAIAVVVGILQAGIDSKFKIQVLPNSCSDHEHKYSSIGCTRRQIGRLLHALLAETHHAVWGTPIERCNALPPV